MLRLLFIYANPAEVSIVALRDKILIRELNMLAPDVIDTTTNFIVISSDGDLDALLTKKLIELRIEDGAIPACDDFKQDIELKLFIRSANHLIGDEFEVTREDSKKKEVEKSKKEDDNKAEKNKEDDDHKKKG